MNLFQSKQKPVERVKSMVNEKTTQLKTKKGKISTTDKITASPKHVTPALFLFGGGTFFSFCVLYIAFRSPCIYIKWIVFMEPPLNTRKVEFCHLPLFCDCFRNIQHTTANQLRGHISIFGPGRCLLLLLLLLLSHPSLPGTSLAPTVISTAQASSFILQYFPYYVWCSKYGCLCTESIECFPGMASKFFFKPFVTIPVALTYSSYSTFVLCVCTNSCILFSILFPLECHFCLQVLLRLSVGTFSLFCF